MGIRLQRKVLQRIAVSNGLLWRGLSELENLWVFAGVVLDDTLANLGNVQKSVEKI